MNSKIVFIYMVFLMMGVVVFNGTAAQAAEIHVTTTADNVPGSLRAAITTVNTNNEDNTIYLPAGTYFLSGNARDDANISGDLDIDTIKSITINGEDARTTIIDGDAYDRVLHILRGTVSIYGVTFKGGNGGGSNGGGIFNSKNGELALMNCVVRNNNTGSSENNKAGGGIYNNGSLMLTNCTINNNTTGGGRDDTHDSAGSGGNGGGIYNNNLITLTNCTISNNRNGKGGDFWTECTGSVGGSGGGIFNNSSGTAFITSCTISGNSTGVGGYGDETVMCHWGPYGPSGFGGGICNVGTIIEKNTIIANNEDNDGGGPDYSGTLNSLGYNLIENTDQCTIIGINKGNITGIDPLLGPLAYNGGPTKTQALLTGSPAIDAGYSFGSIDDQRGFVRPYNIPDIPDVNDGSDIGAYEYSSYLPSPYYNLSGKITCYGMGLPGVTLVFSNNGGSTTTGPDGHYSHPVLYNWSGTVTPTKEGYTFNPSSRNYTALTTNQSDQDYTAVSLVPPQIFLNRTQLYFGAKSGGAQTNPQSFIISNSGGGLLNWTAAADTAWLTCNPTSGTSPELVTVSINPTGLLPTTYTGNITVADPNAANSPQAVKVTLTVYDAGSTNLPWGSFDTPLDGVTVTGSIPVTGWALDNIGIEYVKIYREAAGESAGLVYIGDAVMVEGARPDIEAAFPGYPNNYKAGWGYMLLTHGLPNQGNGTYTLYAVASDKEGQAVTLGTKTIYGDNANAVKPFGAIDMPAQGGTASGSDYINYGWALTPLPNTIPTTGSTITVWVDGIPLGHPVYNDNRPDVAALFPGYNNSTGAGGHFHLDTTAYDNGVHTISWSVSDDAGNSDGIGSRFFTIRNLAGSTVQGIKDTGGTVDWENYKLQNTNYKQITSYKLQNTKKAASSGQVLETPSALVVETQYLASLQRNPNTVSTNSLEPMHLKRGYNQESEPEILYPDENGRCTVEIQELERIVIYLDDLEIQSDGGEYEKAVSKLAGEHKVHPYESPESLCRGGSLCPPTYYQGYLINGDRLKPLPIGSTLDHSRGVFYWQPGPGFLGDYELVFIEKTGIGERMEKHIFIRIVPHSR